MISVNLDEDGNLAAKFLQQNKANFPVIYDSTGSIAEKFQILGMPSSFVIDKTGKKRFAHTGFFSKKQAQYEQNLKL